jgi:hypothetical protein
MQCKPPKGKNQGDRPKHQLQTDSTKTMRYMTVEDKELMLAAVGDKPDKEGNYEEVLAAVAHYIVTHYAEKEVIKKKKKCKPKSGQYQLDVGIKQCGKQGWTAVTKELNQFNKYKVFKPQHAKDLSEEDKKKRHHPSYS